MTAAPSPTRISPVGTRDRGRYAPWIAALAAAMVYACTVGGTYIYDDVIVLLWDPRIKQPALWAQFWTQKYMTGSADQLFRPLVSMSFAIQWWLHGDRPWAFHLVNVLLHAGVAGLVAALGRRIAGARTGWIAGLLFAVHPVHVEAVAGLVGRCELACALGTVAGLLIFLSGRLTAYRIAAIGACFLVAVLSKEQGMLFPLILLAAVPLRRHVGPAPKRGHWLGLAFLLSAILCAYIVWREAHVRFWWDHALLDWEFNPLMRSRGNDRWLMPVVLLGHNALLLVAPVKLSIDYGAMVIGWRASFRDPYLYFGFAALLAWGLLMARSLMARRWDLFLCLWALALSYGMVANAIILIGTNMGERLLYLPSVFFVLILAIAMRKVRPITLWPAIVCAVLLGGAWTMINAERWNDRFHFYQWSLENQPKSVRVYALLFNEYSERNDWENARRVASLCRAELPGCWEAYQMCVLADLQLGDLDAAREAINSGLAVRPVLELKMLYSQVAERILDRTHAVVPVHRGSSLGPGM